MSSRNTLAKNKDTQDTQNVQEYLAYPSEPKEFASGADLRELEAELLQNRYFLKHRVWRNARKFKRHAVS